MGGKDDVEWLNLQPLTDMTNGDPYSKRVCYRPQVKFVICDF